jgi:predicted HD phosphohydrolase
MSIVTFRSFDEATAEEWGHIGEKFAVFERKMVDHVVEALKALAVHDLGYPVDRYVHSLQTATMALRAGADDETVVCALVHDVGDALAPNNHGALAATMVAPYVAPENAWMVENHEAFQGYYYAQYFGGDRMAREKFRGHPAFERTAIFTDQWDQKAFDPGYDTLPIEAFMPALHAIFSRPVWGAHTKAKG